MACKEIVSLRVSKVDLGGQLIWIKNSKTPNRDRPIYVNPDVAPYLKILCQGKSPEARVFEHDRKWPTTQVKEVCKKGKIPIVTAHGMRGMWATMKKLALLSDEAVSRGMGHGTSRVTNDSYIDQNVSVQAESALVFRLIGQGTQKNVAPIGQGIGAT